METANKDALKRIFLFVFITFSLTLAYCFLLLYPQVQNEASGIVPAVPTQLLVAAVMFFPSLGVLLTRLITKEGFKNSWLKPNFRKNLRFYLLAWFGPGVLTVLGSALYFLLIKSSFDPAFGFMRLTLEFYGTAADAMPAQLAPILLSQFVQALLLSPILNFVLCFGEEWGWRGYLLPKISEKLSTLPALFITGIIWGLWHAPLTAIGHNYGVGYAGFPFTGIGMMCLFCIVIGIFLSYVSLKTKSCIPAVLGHGAFNGIAKTGMYLTADGGDPFVGPAPTGIIGMIPFIIAAVLILFSLSGHKKETA
ncbi:MAG: CPBP family intramembrane metalloprotease [Oscillospiraceae bacterium]|nr:CPBP family intramembrane metalloprotease [Oscillospiraceae bacterium]